MSGLRYAFSLSKQEVAEADPPGTVRVGENILTTPPIHRSPPPSNSPADPLNWPRRRKDAILFLMSLYAFTANFGSAALAPALTSLIPLFHGTQTFATLSHLIAYNVLLIGLSNIFWVPLASTFGSRPVLIAAMSVGVAASVWCGVEGRFGALLAARAVQGVGFGPADSVAASVVGGVFFVGERGRAMTIYTIFLAGGSFVGGLCGGYIAGIQGYQYIFWITTALMAFVLLGTILFVPETSFDREKQLFLERESFAGDAVFEEKTANVEMIEQANPLSQSRRDTFTYAQSLKVGVYRGHLLRNFLAPWLSLAFPGTWIVMLHYGGLLGGLVTISIVGPQILAMPPYLWGNNSGLINIAGLLGTILGGALNYLLSDRLITRHKHQTFEPERRLPLLFPFLFLATTGIWTFGFCVSHSWVGMCVGYAMVGAGITGIPSLGFGYIIDSYNPIAADCFVMTTISRSVVSFAWTFFVGEWVETAGAEVPFGIFGGIMGLFAVVTVPFWWWGKRLRIATGGLLPREE